MEPYPSDSESRWEPTPSDLAFTERLLASNDEIDRIYGEIYRARCFICEFHSATEAQDLVAVGEMDSLVMIEKRTGVHLEPWELNIDDCIAFGAYTGIGSTRAERLMDAFRQVIEAREKKRK